MTLRLKDLKPGDRVKVSKIDAPFEKLDALNSMGLFQGVVIEFIRAAPLGDPVEIRLGNSRLSLRKKDCEFLEFTKE